MKKRSERGQDRLKKNKTTTERKIYAFPTGHAKLNIINKRVPIIQPTRIATNWKAHVQNRQTTNTNKLQITKETFTPTSSLLWKFTFKPDVASFFGGQGYLISFWLTNFFTTEHLIFLRKRGKKFKLPHIKEIYGSGVSYIKGRY